MIMRIPALQTLVRKAAHWDESKHPRADNGQFGSGSGTSRGGSKKPKPSKTRRNMNRREAEASQARTGGAIQTLLSGGSALDKVAWFKQPEKKPEPEPSILDTMAQSWSQSEAMRGKVPTLEHPSQRSAREGGPEGGHSPRVLTQAERDYRDNQRQTEDARRRAGVPIPGDQLATLEIPGKIKVEDGEVACSKILSLGNKRAGVMQHTDGRFVVLSQVDRKTVDRKEFKHLDVANRYAEAWLKGGQAAPTGAGLSLESFTQDWINSSRYAEKYRANPRLVPIPSVENHWVESLQTEAEKGPLSAEAIESFKQRFGEAELLRMFRGRTGKGLSNYTPDNKELAHKQNPAMF